MASSIIAFLVHLVLTIVCSALFFQLHLTNIVEILVISFLCILAIATLGYLLMLPIDRVFGKRMKRDY